MIDKMTGARVIVKINEELGPFVQLSSFDDAGALGDALDELTVLYFTGPFEGATDGGGAEFYFGVVADPGKVQELMDSLEFE